MAIEPILVTGAAGFIASKVCDLLLNDGHQVIGVDNLNDAYDIRLKDWRLALAAYNAGEGTVDKLLAGRKTKTYDTIATRLPAETQMYVPRVEATVLRREGVRVGRLR